MKKLTALTNAQNFLKRSKTYKPGDFCWDTVWKPLQKIKSPTDLQLISKSVGEHNIYEVCHECKETKEEVVYLGEKGDYPSFKAHVCQDCLEKALELIKSKKLEN